jgi:hypothetical protein
MKRIALAVAAVTLLTAGVASATEPQPVNQGGVKITAPVTFNQTFDNNTNYASGEDNVAVQALGAIVGNVEVGGRVDFNQTFTNQTNYADGTRNKAYQLNGSIVGADVFSN